MPPVLPDGRKIWLSSFYGFDPEQDGYFGWTYRSDRDRFIRQSKSGDIIMIYAAESSNTDRSSRKSVLGFLLIEARPISDTQKISAASLKWKCENHWANRWRFAVPVRRAWRVQGNIPIEKATPNTYQPNDAMTIARRGKRLEPDDLEQVLTIPVKEANVFGEPAITGSPMVAAIGDFIMRPAIAVTQAFLYLAGTEEQTRAELGRYGHAPGTLLVVKVGVTTNLAEVTSALNAEPPHPALGRWSIRWKAAYPDRQSAEAAERALRALAEQRLERVGNDLFRGRSSQLDTIFASAPGVSRR